MATTSNATAYFADRYRNKSAQELARLADHEEGLLPEARDALRAEIASRSALSDPATAHAEALHTSEDSPNEVAGWMFLYCLGLIFAAIRVVLLATLEIALKGDIPLMIALFLYGAAAWNIATAVAILLRARFALTMVFDQLLMMANIAAFSLGIRFALHFFPDEFNPATVPILSNVLLAAETLIWYLYFRKSKRVLATFGRNL